jgi:hypothetical protein
MPTAFHGPGGGGNLKSVKAGNGRVVEVTFKEVR